jgi:branched-chain amino acid transport system substrate-binding protein
VAYASSKLHVGVITPLSGSLTASGEAVRESVILADELYDKTNLVEFTFEDDGFLPKNSVTIARKFIADRVDAIIVFGTPTALAIAPLTERTKVPLAAISILDKVVQDKNYTVRHFVSWQEETQRVVQEVRRLGYQRIAMVTTQNDASLALRDGFISQSGVEIVLNEEFGKDDLDFRVVAARIKGLRPDAVYHLLFSPQGSAFMKSLRGIGCRVPVFGAHNVEDPQEVQAAQGAYEDLWFVTGDDRAGRFYVDAYQKKHGVYPAMGGANAFDYAKMIIESAQEGVPVLEKFKELRNFEGAYGQYGAAPGNAFEIQATIRIIKGGTFIEKLP